VRLVCGAIVVRAFHPAARAIELHLIETGALLPMERRDPAGLFEVRLADVPHGTDVITQDTLSSGNATPTAPGMMGGYPGSVNVYKFKTGTDIRQRLAAQQMIGDIAEVNGEEVTLQLRQENFLQRPDDVYAVIWAAGAGFGDPFERDPRKVRDDVVDSRSVSVAAAREIYGVVIDAAGQPDLDASALLRAARRDARRRKDEPVKRLTGKVIARTTDSLDLRREAGGVHLCCSRCAADLGPVRENYKDQCVKAELYIRAANPNIGDWRRYIDDRPVFRQFYCPGCGGLIENEVARENDAVLRDIELHLARGKG
jgi:N-methylhydantoinase B